MRVVIDECVPRQVVDELTRRGDEVVAVADVIPTAPDEQVQALAVERRGLLLTDDKDFGELVFGRAQPHGGILLCRLAALSNEAQATLVADTLAERGEDLVGGFSVLTPTSLRIRTQAE